MSLIFLDEFKLTGGNAKHTAGWLDVLLDLFDSKVKHRLNLHLRLRLLLLFLLLLHRSLLHCSLAALADEPGCDAKVKRLQVPFGFETVVLETLLQKLVGCLWIAGHCVAGLRWLRGKEVHRLHFHPRRQRFRVGGNRLGKGVALLPCWWTRERWERRGEPAVQGERHVLLLLDLLLQLGELVQALLQVDVAHINLLKSWGGCGHLPFHPWGRRVRRIRRRGAERRCRRCRVSTVVQILLRWVGWEHGWGDGIVKAVTGRGHLHHRRWLVTAPSVDEISAFPTWQSLKPGSRSRSKSSWEASKVGGCGEQDGTRCIIWGRWDSENGNNCERRAVKRPTGRQRSHNFVPIDCSDKRNGHDKEISIGEGRRKGPLPALLHGKAIFSLESGKNESAFYPGGKFPGCMKKCRRAHWLEPIQIRSHLNVPKTVTRKWVWWTVVLSLRVVRLSATDQMTERWTELWIALSQLWRVTIAHVMRQQESAAYAFTWLWLETEIMDSFNILILTPIAMLCDPLKLIAIIEWPAGPSTNRRGAV